MEEAERHCERLAIIDMGHLVEQGEPAELAQHHNCESLEEVFTTVTGRDIDQTQGGRLSDVRAQRSVVRRLG
jgi:ABC-type Na+ transport system ATPase subunit NatA